MTMDFSTLGPDELLRHIHTSILEREMPRLAALSRALEEQWAFAAAHRDRPLLRKMVGGLIDVAATAAVFEEEEARMARWNERWRVLADMADLILAFDVEGTTVEDRERLKKFEHAEKLVRFLHRQGAASLDEIRAALDLNSPQAAWNHVARLVKLGLLLRVDEGIYRLSLRGRDLARLLVGEEKSARPDLVRRVQPEPVADVAHQERWGTGEEAQGMFILTQAGVLQPRTTGHGTSSGWRTFYQARGGASPFLPPPSPQPAAG